MTFDDQLVQVVALLGSETTQAEIVEDHQVWSQVAAKNLVVGTIRSRLAQLGQQRIGADEQHRMAGANARCAQTLGQHGLADADGSNQDGMFLTGEKLEREQRLELATIELDWRGPVE